MLKLSLMYERFPITLYKFLSNTIREFFSKHGRFILKGVKTSPFRRKFFSSEEKHCKTIPDIFHNLKCLKEPFTESRHQILTFWVQMVRVFAEQFVVRSLM